MVAIQDWSYLENKAELDKRNCQNKAAVNYTDRETSWAKIIEHKCFVFDKNEDGNDFLKTIISCEYISEWKPDDGPYYPQSMTPRTAHSMPSIRSWRMLLWHLY